MLCSPAARFHLRLIPLQWYYRDKDPKFITQHEQLTDIQLYGKIAGLSHKATMNRVAFLKTEFKMGATGFGKQPYSPYTFSDSETIDDTNSTINSDFAYCKIYESNFANINKRAYSYSWKGENTTNLIAHLKDKHNITKDNYSEYLDEHEEPIAEFTNHSSTTYSPKQQELITRKVTAFIKNVQPLFVLQNQAF
ncbi:hypothetical protein RhiirA4_473417 [Rhizophagus irregularis]|uniref:Uncharacterized protein n=1 Tax=Rhizophagus irregularis TaxID=588596 RepID=A0A2I1H6P2_9GLOM|nr:hypothetical protein RhiirA4_473417 [Rhizophagus irregularis]